MRLGNTSGVIIRKDDDEPGGQGSGILFQPASDGAPFWAVCFVHWYTIAFEERISLFHQSLKSTNFSSPHPNFTDENILFYLAKKERDVTV